MPISIVVGGQYGSEGKGKVALDLVRRNPTIRIVVRPGGTNSGHTGYTSSNQKVVLRQLPAAAIDGNIIVVIPPGSYVDVALLKEELKKTNLPSANLVIDPRAHVITGEHIDWERSALLSQNVASTLSGTGAAVLSRLARHAPGIPAASVAANEPELRPFLRDTSELLDAALSDGERVLIEGTQGFGLSPLHGDSWPKATGRDTTAAGFLSEAGLSPIQVDEIVLVIRAFEIRVAGNSGPLSHETTWEEISRMRGAFVEPEETSVTRRVRRIGHFDPEVVRKAIRANHPTKIALNHLDYVDATITNGRGLTHQSRAFLHSVQESIGCEIQLVGTGPQTTICVREQVHGRAA